MRYCIFCSANNNIEEAYFAAARELGRRIGAGGHTLVFGGTNTGLMDCLAENVKKAGGRTLGVVPSKVEEGGKTSPYLDDIIRCDNLNDRKEHLIRNSDMIIAMPGGVGTLDEIFTVLAASSIGYHRKRLILFNVNGFWNPLLDLLSALEERKMLRPGFKETINVVDSVDEIIGKTAKSQIYSRNN